MYVQALRLKIAAVVVYDFPTSSHQLALVTFLLEKEIEAGMDLARIKQLLIEEQSRITLQHYTNWTELTEFERGYQMCLDKWLPVMFYLLKTLQEQ